jgi:hypothetical protein
MLHMSRKHHVDEEGEPQRQCKGRQETIENFAATEQGGESMMMAKERADGVNSHVECQRRSDQFYGDDCMEFGQIGLENRDCGGDKDRV